MRDHEIVLNSYRLKSLFISFPLTYYTVHNPFYNFLRASVQAKTFCLLSDKLVMAVLNRERLLAAHLA